jgi:polyribonucleotide nucleotidyltransferase
MQTKAPFAGPIAAISVGMIDGQFVINPSEEELENSELNLSFAATKDRIMMIETEANDVSEEKVFEAMKFGHEAMQESIQIQHKIAEDHRKIAEPIDQEDKILGAHAEIHNLFSDKIKEALSQLDKEV